MKRLAILTSLLLLPILFASCAPRAEPAGPAPRPVVRLPATPAAADKLLDELSPGMGAESIAAREAPQMEWEAVCVEAGRPGNEAARALVCAAMDRRLGPKVARPARVWLLRQLERIGGEESVAKLTELLDDPDGEIRECARRALQNNPSPRAGAALRAALTQARDPAWRVALINALAVRREPESVFLLTAYAEARDANVVAAAIAALAESDEPAAIQKLYALWRTRSAPVQDAAAAALVRRADALLARGQNGPAGQVYRDIYDSGVAAPIRFSALRGLAAAEQETALPLLLELLASDDPQAGRLAARFALDIPGPAAPYTLAARLPALRPEVQVLVLDGLAERGDPSIRPTVLPAVESPRAEVRVAAIRALGALGDSSTVSLLARLAAAGSEDESAAAVASLARLKGADVDEAILAQMKTGDAAVRAALIRSLGARHCKTAVPELLTALADAEEAVRTAACEVLGQLAQAEHLPRLIERVMVERGGQATPAAENAVVAVANRIPDWGKRVEPVLAVLPDTSGAAQAALIRVLGRIGGGQALDAIRQARRSNEPEVVDAAVRALADWPDAGVLPDLLDVTRTATDQAHRVLALRGYVRLVRLPTEREPGETLAMLRTALEVAERPDEKKLALAGVADVVTLDALRFVEAHLGDETLREEAAATVLAIAQGLSAFQREEALAAIEKVAALAAGEAVQRRVQETRDFVARYTGYCADWAFSGPYVTAELLPASASPGSKAPALFDAAFPPEQEGGGADWVPLPITDLHNPWTFDLAQAFGGSSRCVYAKARVWSEAAQAALLEVGSDDAVKAWLNGEVVHANNTTRGLTVAADKVPIQLQAGWNALMLKVVQASGSWGFCGGLKEPDGGNLDGVRFEAEPSQHNVLAGAERQAGWRLLFDGQTTTGWRGYRKEGFPQHGWKVHDGCLTRLGPGGDIITDDEFDNFELQLEWRISPNGNSGIFFRVSEEYGWPWETGPEMQVLDNAGHRDGQNPQTSAGSNYALHAPVRDVTRPVGRFNQACIVADGPHVEYWLNGVKVVEYDLNSKEWQQLVAESKFAKMPDCGRKPKGRIVLQDHGDKVWYRNIKIRPLPARR